MKRLITIVINGNTVKASEEVIKSLLGIQYQNPAIMENGNYATDKSIYDIAKPAASGLELPTIPKIIEYIRNQPDYTHNLRDISIHFLGTSINAKENKNAYNLLWRKTSRARKRIEKEEKKHNLSVRWESERNSIKEPAIYRFMKE